MGGRADEPASLLIVTTIPATLRSFLLPYAAHFRSLGWRVEAAARHAPDDDLLGPAFDRVHHVPLSRSIRDVRGLVRAERAIGRLAASGAYDLVHVHTPIASFLTRYAVRRLPARRRPAVVYTAHGFHFHRAGTPLANLVFRTAERIAGRWTDRLVVINEEDEAAARRHRIVPPARLRRMPGIGVDTDRFDPATVAETAVASVRRSLALPPGAPVLVFVGEFSANKRQADAIAALGRVRDPRTILVLAGGDRGRERVERLVRAANLEDRVRFAGFVDDLRPLLRAATALLLTSRREGLARSLMEALSMAVPAIVSSARGNRELVGDDAGFVLPTGDVAALAERIDWLCEHPSEAAAMGRAGRARMISQFDQRRLIELHEALYADVLAERASAVS